jgi:hypothetical protein
MVLQPVGADHYVAQNQREKFAPLLGHGAHQVAITLRTLGRSGDLDLDDQQGQRDCENRVAEPLEAVEPAHGTVGFHVVALAWGFRWHQVSPVAVAAARQSLE